ncbi:ROK family transcriptional regulator [Arthrobacter monumenti]
MTGGPPLSAVPKTTARRGTNLPRMGDFNQTVVLDAIRRSRSGLSRVELAAATGLSAQTLSNIAKRLLDQALVVESGKIQSARGKPRTVLSLNPTARYAVGVHLDPAITTCVILDLSGKVVARSTFRTPTATDPEVTIDVMVTVITDLLDQTSVDQDRVIGIGVASPGPVDCTRGIVVNPPNLHGWQDVPIRDALSRKTGLPVVLEKDVAAAAVAEIWGGDWNSREYFVFVYLSTGIGMGLVSGEGVIRGSTQNAGEVGHIVVDPDGPECVCGLRGCLAVTCMPANLVDEAHELGVLPDPVDTSDPLSIETAFILLCKAANSGDELARAIIERSARRVAKAASVLTNALDFNRVVFGGPYWPMLSEVYLDIVPEALHALTVEHSIHPLQVDGTVLGTDVGAVGAACTVFNNAISPQTKRLLLSS